MKERKKVLTLLLFSMSAKSSYLPYRVFQKSPCVFLIFKPQSLFKWISKKRFALTKRSLHFSAFNPQFFLVDRWASGKDRGVAHDADETGGGLWWRGR